MFILGMLYHVALEGGLNSHINNSIIRFVGRIPEFELGKKLFHLGWVKAGQWLYW